MSTPCRILLIPGGVPHPIPNFIPTLNLADEFLGPEFSNPVGDSFTFAREFLVPDWRTRCSYTRPCSSLSHATLPLPVSLLDTEEPVAPVSAPRLAAPVPTPAPALALY